ncbi:MAG: hypothetical protein CBC29_05245 [Methylococcaceae bacterium TMED69]|nr:MAG: hypothetical protein CBC29_05245 [Methylococcaceae bacterium TMED69]|tara:strand:+ start:307 stop:1002 length:696 start_codon:yes stop_codon:yes gene_type:complete
MTVARTLKLIIHIFVYSALFLLLSCASPRLPGTKFLDINQLPFVHKIDIQQGNVITQDMLGQLEIGMEKKRIEYIMGTPSIKHTFKSSTWDYFFSYRYKDEYTEDRRITLHFDDSGTLAFLSGNVQASETAIPVKKFKDVKVAVPRYKELSNLQKFKNKIPFKKKIRPQVEEDGQIVTKEYAKFEKMISERKKINSDVYVGIKPSPGKKALNSKDEYKEQKSELDETDSED